GSACQNCPRSAERLSYLFSFPSGEPGAFPPTTPAFRPYPAKKQNLGPEDTELPHRHGVANLIHRSMIDIQEAGLDLNQAGKGLKMLNFFVSLGAFIGSHILISRTTLKPWLVTRLGMKTYLVLYSALSILLL